MATRKRKSHGGAGMNARVRHLKPPVSFSALWRELQGRNERLRMGRPALKPLEDGAR